ncbi:HipA family kinase [Shinella sumterensis]|uniref:HipA family kinase n=1 Tax=Shinella sumterensis TaxID=1967501 RepID=UPI003F824D9B
MRPMKNGKTGPALVLCQKTSGDEMEVVVKCSIGCEQKEASLAAEVIGACLAADLGLPIPEPFLVELDPNFIGSIPDVEHRDRMAMSNFVAFGSKHVTGQYSAWTNGNLISEGMLPNAAAVFAFDAIIQNPDRRDGNPNCLVRGDEIRIIDHELAFAHGLILFWKAPWVLGGLQNLETPGLHIFRAGLMGRAIDYTPIRKAWIDLSDARISEYGNAVPTEWGVATKSVASALQLIKDARDNIDACITEIQRVLQ